jgi:hypothetical protein
MRSRPLALLLLLRLQLLLLHASSLQLVHDSREHSLRRITIDHIGFGALGRHAIEESFESLLALPSLRRVLG